MNINTNKSEEDFIGDKEKSTKYEQDNESHKNKRRKIIISKSVNRIHKHH